MDRKEYIARGLEQEMQYISNGIISLGLSPSNYDVKKQAETNLYYKYECEETDNLYARMPADNLMLRVFTDYYKNKGIPAEIKDERTHMLIIGGRFLIAFNTGRWKRLGYNKWYNSKGVDDFYERFYIPTMLREKWKEN